MALRDHRGCELFLDGHPEVLCEEPAKLDLLYVEKAVGQIVIGTQESRKLALSYIEKYSIITLIQAEQTRRALGRLIDEDKETKEKFEAIVSRVNGQCEQKAKEKRHDQIPPLPTTAVDRITEKLRRIAVHEHEFKQLPPSDWKGYFKPGRVFATHVFDEYNNEGSVARIQVGNTTVNKKMIMMVVIASRDAFCIVVPIHTYGGKGLKKAGFRLSNVNAHARAYLSNGVPIWLEGEPHTGKHDIEISPIDQKREFHPASRICFERPASIDYNKRLQKIGSVIPAHLPYLIGYYKLENERPSGQDRPRQRGNSGESQEAAEQRHRSEQQDPRRSGRHVNEQPEEGRYEGYQNEGNRHGDDRYVEARETSDRNTERPRHAAPNTREDTIPRPTERRDTSALLDDDSSDSGPDVGRQAIHHRHRSDAAGRHNATGATQVRRQSEAGSDRRQTEDRDQYEDRHRKRKDSRR